MPTPTTVEAYKLWDDFLSTWPVERLETMSLQDYTSAGSKDTFTYWIESKLDSLGSIWGGSAFKFGIYSRADKSPKASTEYELYDDDYAWAAKYGATRNKAFAAVRSRILEVAQSSAKRDAAAIDAVDLGRAYKWKVAFHYQPRETPFVLNVFKPEPLALFLGLKAPSGSQLAELYSQVLAKREPGEDLLDFARRVWEPWSKRLTIWKMSHGPGVFTESEQAELLEKHLLVMHRETGWGQGSLFLDDARIGELVYLCHGNAVQLIGRIKSAAKPYEKGDGGFFSREYELLRTSNNQQPFEEHSQKWTPRGNSTFWQVPKGALKEFEQLILRPYFAMGLPDLEILGTKGDEDPTGITGVVPPPLPEGDAFSYPLNLILYGPPGTGKTYSSVVHAMSIVDGKPYDMSELRSKYEALKQRFDQCVESGQISFTTFHQSYSYEDFVEGIRPIGTGSALSYGVQPGVLRVMAERARENYDKAGVGVTPNSLESFDFEAAYGKLLEAIGESDSQRIKVKLFKGAEAEVAHAPRAQGLLVTVPGYPTEFNVPKSRLRELWARRQSIKRPSDVKLYSDSFFFGVLKHLESIAPPPNAKPAAEARRRYVLIIDEINRGNIARIFGELITLLEPDKRLGHPNAVSAVLPYSSESFILPPNLYIVGTMNTADRSIALLDTALRRRFAFEEMPPNPDLLSDDVDGVNLKLFLTAINRRIQYLYDRDHTVGHSYFMGVNTFEALRERLLSSVIPLLQEYFYDDWEKIQLIFRDQGRPFEEQIISNSILDPIDLFGKTAEDMGEKAAYRVNERFSVNALTKVYE